MKALKLTGLLLIFPITFFGQKQLTGLWIGTLNNDSSTTRKEQSFEIALTEYRGKVYGYSRSEFIINDTLYYILKRVKGTITGDSCEVKDDEILSYNFRGRLDKGVKVISTFRMNKEDSTWHLDGNWRTTKTKKFYPLTGNIKLQEEKDISQSKIFPHLEELNLADNIPFYKEQKKLNTSVAENQPDRSKEEKIVNNKKNTQPSVNGTETVAVSSKDEKINNLPVEKTETGFDTIKTAPRKKEEPIAVNTPEIKKTNVAVTSGIPDVKKPVIAKTGPAAFVDERKLAFTQPVNFKSDSLELSLYDNGEIDGDTVSVLLNGQIIIAKQCLKATAIKKTIYITPQNGDSLVLVLYAENLGKYPPNTGLLVIHDGEDVYNVGFSADLQTNAAIILRRKK